MTSTRLSFRLRPKFADRVPLNLIVFLPPPLRPPPALDIGRDLDAIRHRRNLLSQRIGAVWLRGHGRDI